MIASLLSAGRCVTVAKLLPSKSESVQVGESPNGENTASRLFFSFLGPAQRAVHTHNGSNTTQHH